MRQIITLFLIVFASLSPLPASAHQLSTAYLQLNVDASRDTQANGQLQVRFFDLERAIGIDTDKNGQLTWAEVLQHRAAIESYLSQNLQVSSAQQACSSEYAQSWQTDRHFDEGFLVVNFVTVCPQAIANKPLEVTYSGIFQQDPNHKLLVNLGNYASSAEQTVSLVLDQSSQTKTLQPDQTYVWETFSTYLYQGIVHILIGTDHILFLLVLLMSCVLYREMGKWHAQHKLVPVLKSAAWIVTAFTLAHSVTLTATALNWITPSTRWVEVGIALSVLITALNNIWPIVVRLGWITFGFGLLHGMGFASVLSELGLSTQHQVTSILAFNLGVEVGQLAIVAIALPLFYLCRHFWIYRWLVLRLGSAVIGVVALNWAIQRV